MGKFTEIESRFIRGWEEHGGLLLYVYRVSIWGDGNVLELYSGDGCTI